MDGTRWQQVEQIIDQALDLPDDQRRTFISDKAGDDIELLQAAEKFLNSIDQANRTNFLEPDGLKKQALFEELDKEKSTAAENYIGIRIGNFTVNGILGHGGMATVFKAERSDKSIQQTVAIKILHSSLHSQESLIRFRMEQEILANLNHPNIAHFVDAGVTEDDNPYFIMEYVDGVSITEYCKENQLGTNQKLQLFRQLCEAVSFAHRNLVVHRDLKPNNVFVNKDEQVKVLDFSIAKLLDPGFSDQNFVQTRAGTKLLSPTYCAPEQFEMDPITTATDVYTLGLVLYEMLSGKKAIEGKNKTLKEIQTSICSPDFSKTLHLNEDSELSAIIMKATRKEPEYRYESAAQLLDDLKRYEKAVPLLAQRDSVSYRISKFAKRNYKAVSITLIIFLGSILFGNYHLQQINKQREFAELESDKATAVTDYMIDLFGLADPEKNANDTLNVFDLLELGKDRLPGLENQPEVLLKMLEVLGDANFDIGEVESASEFYILADSIANKTFSDNHIEILKTSLNLGEYYVYSRNYKSANPYLRKSLKISIENPSVHPVYRAASYLSLARSLVNTRPDSAEIYFLNSLEMYKKISDNKNEQLTNVYLNLGVLYRTQEKYDQAVEVYAKADSLIQISDSGLIEDKAVIYNNLGYLHMQLQNFELAKEYYRMAYEYYSAVYGDDHPNSITIAKNIRSVLERQGNLTELEKYSKNLLNLVENKYGYNHWQTASQLTSHALVSLILGKDLDAYEYAKKGNSIYVKVLGPNHDWTIDSEIRKNLLKLNNKRSKIALADFNESRNKLAAAIKQNEFTTSAESNLKSALDKIQKHSTKDLSKEVNLIRELLSD